MHYFSPTFIKFFKELSKNNTIEWFNSNRKIYENEVKKPFAIFVDEMINRIRNYEPNIDIKPADAIMRINKDIRFSKDKTPYNTHIAANISVYGKKDKSYPGFYFKLSYDKIEVFGGAYMVEAPILQTIRTNIAQNLNDFKKSYNSNEFKEKFGELKGEQSKRIPEEFQSVVAKEPLIANKQFYYSTEINAEIITQENLPEVLMGYYLAGKKVNDFLIAALKN